MRRPIKKRAKLEPDEKYQNVSVSRLINYVMERGKKSIARKIVYDALAHAEKELKKPAMEVLVQVIENAGPELELRSRRIGGANYQVPYEVSMERRTILAFRWIIEASRKAKGKDMYLKLAEEFKNAYNNTGVAVKKKADTHRMADANKAFAHFAW